MNTFYNPTNQFVAFIDILGFKDIIKNDRNPEKIIRVIDDAYKHISEIEKSHCEDCSDPESCDECILEKLKITWFSDSLIISINAENPYNLNVLIETLEFIQSSLVSQGILIRGAVALGECHHMNNNVFGKAMIEAYELESSKAIVPRIILSNTLVEYINTNHSKELDYNEASYNASLKNPTWHSEIEAERYINYTTFADELFKDYLTKDKDGLYYIRYLDRILLEGICTKIDAKSELNNRNNIENKSETCHYDKDYYNLYYNSFILPVKQLINEGIKNPMTISLKYLWLKEYYNKTIAMLDTNLENQFKLDFYDKIFIPL